MEQIRPAERMSEERKLAFRHYLTPDASLSVSALRQVGREIFDELDAVEADKNTALLHLAQAIAERHSIRTERDAAIAALTDTRPCCGHLGRFHDPIDDDTHSCSQCALIASNQRTSAAIADKDEYAEVLEDKRRLTRELDVIVNGADAAKQASLCDMVAQIRSVVPKLRAERDALRAAIVCAAIPLEVLAGQIRVKPYVEMTESLQREVLHSVHILRSVTIEAQSNGTK